MQIKNFKEYVWLRHNAYNDMNGIKFKNFMYDLDRVLYKIERKQHYRNSKFWHSINDLIFKTDKRLEYVYHLENLIRKIKERR